VRSKSTKEPLTLLIIPHSQRRPISVRLPSWTLTGLLLLAASLLAVATTFGLRYNALTHEVARLREEGQQAQVRRHTLQATILAQHDEIGSMEDEFGSQIADLQNDYETQVAVVQSDYDQLEEQVGSFQSDLTAQVEQFITELQQIRRLTDEVRDLVGLEEAALPSPEAKLDLAGGMGTGSARMSLVLDEPTREELSLSKLVDTTSNPTVHQLDAMLGVLPSWYGELQHLHDQVTARVSLVDPERRKSPDELEQQLALWDAAPKGWPLSGRITSTFGYRIFRGRRNFHTGLDVAAWYRTPVHATAPGTVIAAGWESGFGWTVEVAHTKGYSTLYGHLSRYLVDVGDQVAKGQQIGLSGSSGNSTGPHLHYEVRLNGVPVDPWRYATAQNSK
jgi:murein DD-endopeptidase MepM/ murein hydrolase activator NlpD